MSWLDALLLFCVLLGVTAGGFMVARSPSFWVGLVIVIFKRLGITAALLEAAKAVAKRMPPEQERAMQDCIRRGGKWNNIKKRCE